MTNFFFIKKFTTYTFNWDHICIHTKKNNS